MTDPLLFRSHDSAFDITYLVDQLPDGVAVFASDGACLFANPALRSILSLPPSGALENLNFWHMVRESPMGLEIRGALENESMWSGTAQVYWRPGDKQMILTMAAAMDPDCRQFITYLLPLGRESFQAQVWRQLRDSEERYRILVELSPNLIQIHINGVISFINSSGVQMLRGASADEFIGQSIFRYIHPKEHVSIMRRMTREIGSQEKMGPVEERWVRTDGSEFDAEIVALPFEYHGQVAVQVIAIDITERKRAREQLAQYTRQLEALNSIGLSLVSTLNTPKILNEFTQNLGAILHADSLSILLKQQDDLVVVASVGEQPEPQAHQRIPYPSVERLLHGSRSAPIVLTGEAAAQFPSLGKPRPNMIMLEPLLHNDETIGVLQASYFAESDSLAVEQEILHFVSHWVMVALQNSRLYQNEQRQHQYAEGLLKSANAINSNLELPQILDRILNEVWGVIPCSAANIMVIDGAEANLVVSMGYDRYGIDEEWLRTIHFSLDEMAHLKQVQKDRCPIIIRNTVIDPDWVTLAGNTWIRSYAAAPLIVENNVYGFLNLDSDQVDYFGEETLQHLQAFATQASIAIQNAQLVEKLHDALRHEQTIRAQLVQSEKLAGMGRMVASVAHELNNPLQTIQNCLYILNQDGGLKPDMVEHLDTGITEIKRLTGIVDQLRQAYRPSAQKEKLLVRPVVILENVHALLKPHLQHKRIDWVVTSDTDCRVAADVDTLKQVFINLTQNAIDAMQPDGGVLTITLKQHVDGDRVGICFQDQGRGIAAEDLPNLFDPYYTTRELGFGLGLPICRDIVESHGGTIHVESQLGAGSAFTVWLPVKTIE